MNRDIPALTGLRAFAAFCVLALHASHFLRLVGGEPYAISNYLGAGGFLGVDLFFTLSGFILAWNYASLRVWSSPRSYGEFLWKRLARIYPVHVAALILFCVFLLSTMSFQLPYGAWDRQTWGNLVQNLTLVHGWAVPIPKSFNAPSWSISAEWAAYLCFPVLAAMAARFRSVPAACAMMLLLFAALAMNVWTGRWGGSMAYGFVRIAVEFPAGVLLHRVWQLNSFGTSKRFDAVALIAAVLLLFGGAAVALEYGENTALAVMPVLTCVLVYSVAASTTFVARCLSSPLIVHWGRVSFAFYMVHLTWFALVGAVASKYDLWSRRPMMIALLFAAVLAAYACAEWFYRSIEEPARRWMLSRFKSQQSPSAHDAGRALPETV